MGRTLEVVVVVFDKNVVSIVEVVETTEGYLAPFGTFYSSFSICKIVASTGRITSLFAFFGEALVLTGVSILLLQSSYRLEWGKLPI